MVNLDELMKLHSAASYTRADVFLGQLDTHFPGDPEAHYIVAACNAVPELVARIRELESEHAGR